LLCSAKTTNVKKAAHYYTSNQSINAKLLVILNLATKHTKKFQSPKQNEFAI